MGFFPEARIHGSGADDVYGGKAKATSPDGVAMLFDTAQRVLVVSGYGLAVAQAQHKSSPPP